MTQPLPLTILSGDLGAGKTTLINRLLGDDHGLRLMVIVNDFGAINIDAALIGDHTENMIELSNGCGCCTISQDLYAAFNAALDRQPRPDHLIVEASGIADPAAIAQAALVEREVGYGGIITLVDGENGLARLSDPNTGPALRQQIASADLILVTKTDTPAPALAEELNALSPRPHRALADLPLSELLFDLTPAPKAKSTAPHPAYTAWSHESDLCLSRAALGTLLETRPQALYRLKGFVLTDDGAYALQIVGQHVQARRAQAPRTQLVALGLADQISKHAIAAWWQSAKTPAAAVP